MEFNFNKDIKCICGEILSTNEFKSHYKKCDSFINSFGFFDKELSNLIKENSHPTYKLELVKFIFNRYIEIIQKKIRGNFVEISRSFKEEFINTMKQSKMGEGANYKYINQQSIK